MSYHRTGTGEGVLIGCAVALIISFTLLATFILVRHDIDQTRDRRQRNHTAQIAACEARDGVITLDPHGWFKSCTYTP